MDVLLCAAGVIKLIDSILSDMWLIEFYCVIVYEGRY